MTTPVVSGGPGWLNRLRDWIPENYREGFYRVAAAVTTLLLTLGVVNYDKVFLWGQLAVAVVTALFAVLYATSYRNLALYTIVGPLGGLLMAYGLINNAKWAVIAAAVGQLFGITTAAAKTVHPEARAYVLAPPKTEDAPSD